MFKICLNRGHGIKTFVPRTTHNHKSQKKLTKELWFCKKKVRCDGNPTVVCTYPDLGGSVNT